MLKYVNELATPKFDFNHSLCIPVIINLLIIWLSQNTLIMGSVDIRTRKYFARNFMSWPSYLAPEYLRKSYGIWILCGQQMLRSKFQRVLQYTMYE